MVSLVWDRALIVVWYVQEGKYQQYMLTMCDCWEGEWCACVFVWECTLRHTYATRCGCIQQTTHSETRFNKAARPPQSVKTDRPVGSNWRVVKPAESRGRVGGRGATSPLPSPRSQFTHFLQFDRHHLGQDDRKNTNAKIVNVNLYFVPLKFCP